MNPLKLQTEVAVTPLPRQFGKSVRLFAVGSCFATEIGDRLAQGGFSITVNPFGTLYNPASIAEAVKRLASPAPFTADDVIYSEPLGRYNSFWHHTKFSSPSIDSFLAGANSSLQASSEAFGNADVCLVTLGTAWIFRHIASGRVVANCNKIPAREFTRERLSADESYSLLADIVSSNPGKEWIFTVSPIRHLADGAYGNSLSKATLLLAAEKLTKEFRNVYYFPAFEIMMDELRDYRFYAEDLTHPSPLAAEMIFARFMDFAFLPEAASDAARCRKEYRRSMHRPLIDNPRSDETMA